MEVETKEEAAVGGGGGEDSREWEHGKTVEGSCERVAISNPTLEIFFVFFFFLFIRFKTVIYFRSK